MDKYSKSLESLKEQKQLGLITESEFEIKKAKLISIAENDAIEQKKHKDGLQGCFWVIVFPILLIIALLIIFNIL